MASAWAIRPDISPSGIICGVLLHDECANSLRTVLFLSDDLGAQVASQQIRVGDGRVVEFGVRTVSRGVAIIDRLLSAVGLAGAGGSSGGADVLPGLLASGGRLAGWLGPGLARRWSRCRWRCTQVDHGDDPEVDAQNDDQRLPENVLAAAPAEAVPGTCIGHSQGQRAVADVGHLCVLAQQYPGEAALSLNLLEHLRPEPANVGHGQLRGHVSWSRLVVGAGRCLEPRHAG